NDACRAPAILASSTSRDSRSASFVSSAGESDLPSSTPPLITRCGWALAKSRRPLAASTGSPLTTAIADGPCRRSSNAATPATPRQISGSRWLGRAGAQGEARIWRIPVDKSCPGPTESGRLEHMFEDVGGGDAPADAVPEPAAPVTAAMLRCWIAGLARVDRAVDDAARVTQLEPLERC